MWRFAFVASAMLAIALSSPLHPNAFAATPEPSAAPDYVAAVGPLHGAWLVDGKAATIGAPIAAGASIAQARPGTPASIAIYRFDGHLMEKTCPSDPACSGPFGLDPLGDTASIKSVVQDATKALPHYRFAYATPAPKNASDATPVDGIASLATDGVVDFGEIMHGVPHGPYRLVLRPLDPHSGFAPSGDSLFKLFTWNGDAVSVAVGGVPEGLYSAQLFSRDLPDHALGGSAWAAVIATSGTSETRGDAALAGFHSAQALAAKWTDPEAQQLFLRSYLVNAVFPQPTPGPGRHRRGH